MSNNMTDGITDITFPNDLWLDAFLHYATRIVRAYNTLAAALPGLNTITLTMGVDTAYSDPAPALVFTSPLGTATLTADADSLPGVGTVYGIATRFRLHADEMDWGVGVGGDDRDIIISVIANLATDTAVVDQVENALYPPLPTDLADGSEPF